MAAHEDSLARIRNMFKFNNVCKIEDILELSRGKTRMTAFRMLRKLDYLSSYSHRASYYTLREIADFNAMGLCFFGDVRFSRDGNLINTLVRFVNESASGRTAAELDDILGVETKHGALQACRRKLITREKIGRRYVYLSVEAGERRRQKLEREERNAEVELGIGVEAPFLADEVKAAIILFFSLLDEKQRRLYAGLEAVKLGHGGDKRIADFLNLDPHTVAKGRRELLEGDDNPGIRKGGGGNHPVEKKRRKLSN